MADCEDPTLIILTVLSSVILLVVIATFLLITFRYARCVRSGSWKRHSGSSKESATSTHNTEDQCCVNMERDISDDVGCQNPSFDHTERGTVESLNISNETRRPLQNGIKHTDSGEESTVDSMEPLLGNHQEPHIGNHQELPFENHEEPLLGNHPANKQSSISGRGFVDQETSQGDGNRSSLVITANCQSTQQRNEQAAENPDTNEETVCKVPDGRHSSAATMPDGHLASPLKMEGGWIPGNHDRVRSPPDRPPASNPVLSNIQDLDADCALTNDSEDIYSPSIQPDLALSEDHALSEDDAQPQDVIDGDPNQPLVNLSMGDHPPGMFLHNGVANGFLCVSSTTDDESSVSNAIPEAVYNFLDRQRWVKIVMSSGGQLEILVQGIEIDEARQQILDNTPLTPDKLTVMEFISSNFRYLCDSTYGSVKSMVSFFNKDKWRRSTIAGYIETVDGKHQYAITSAHYSGKGVPYNASIDGSLHYLGACSHHFCQNGLDVAVIKLKQDIPKEKMVNTLKLPMLSGLKDVIPEIWSGDLMSLAKKGEPVLKHGPRGLVRGMLEIVFVRRDNRLEPYIAFVAKKWSSGTCEAGDSGSLITSLPENNRKSVKAYGVVSSLYTAKLRDGLVKQFCIISPLWPALDQVQQAEGRAFRFVQPVVNPNTATDIQLTSQSTEKQDPYALRMNHSYSQICDSSTDGLDQPIQNNPSVQNSNPSDTRGQMLQSSPLRHCGFPDSLEPVGQNISHSFISNPSDSPDSIVADVEPDPWFCPSSAHADDMIFDITVTNCDQPSDHETDEGFVSLPQLC